MKCYYEELGVLRDSTEADIKTAYRKLALRWHPDKNLNALEEAKERFQLIQQAYEVLSDPQERAWYDNHRDQILHGKNSDYEEKCLNVFQYFMGSCFKGYADDSKSFYSIYREVFEKIAAEDVEFMDDEEDIENVPSFGDSQSNYEDVVGPFYAYWQSYCTKKSYAWLCPYNIQEIKDRRVLREIEKEMKKITQKAKRERNEEVRNLVSFIRKRDRRVHAYKQQLEERAELNRQKQQQNRLEQIRKRQQELKESFEKSNQSFHHEGYEQRLKELAQQYSDDSCNDESISDESDVDELEEAEIEEYVDDLYCVACNKSFKNSNAFANHETSKKHRDNVERMKKEMHEDEESFNETNNANNNKSDEDEPSSTDLDHQENTKKDKKSKKNKRKNKTNQLNGQAKLDSGPESAKEEENVSDMVSEVKIKDSSDDENWGSSNKKSSKKSKHKKKEEKKSNNQKTSIDNARELKEDASGTPSDALTTAILTQAANDTSANKNHVCATCNSSFDSKNKLFNHLKATNHSVYLPKSATATGKQSQEVSQKKTKSKRK